MFSFVSSALRRACTSLTQGSLINRLLESLARLHICVHAPGASTTTFEPATAQTSTAPSTGSDTKTDAPSPTQSGINANYDKYHKVVSGDQCDTIELQYGITHADFSAWSLSIDDKCSNVWLDYYVCVHVAPRPQMPDITSDCKTYH